MPLPVCLKSARAVHLLCVVLPLVGCSQTAHQPEPANAGAFAGASGASDIAQGGAGGGSGGSQAGGMTGSPAGAAGGFASSGMSSGGSVDTAGAAGSVQAGGASTQGGSSNGASNDYCGARSGLSFCESFEDLPAGSVQPSSRWTPSINGEGSVSIDESVAHAGKHSLKVHGSGFSSLLVLSADGVLPAASGVLYVRAFMRLSESMSAGHNTFIIADLKAAPGSGNAFRLGEDYSMLMYTLSGDAHGALSNQNYFNDQKPGAALEPLRWSCLEVLLDHQKPDVRVWLDETELPDLHHGDWPVDAYDAVRFGFEKYAGPESDIWYDDIAVGSAQLGCR